jgi:hypothetical protein
VQQERPDRFPSCDVCGRTILKGEQVYEYVTPQGQRLGVCILCRSRAETSGWIPAEQVGSVVQAPPSRARRGQALRERLGRAASRARSSGRAGKASEAKGTGQPQPAGETEKAARSEPSEKAQQRPKRQARPRAKPQAKPRSKPQPKQRAAAPRTRRARRGPQAIMRRAVQRFNGSDEPRKVAGLIRSLGEPRAAILPDAERQLALVTVAWELSWYQWEVSSDGDGEAVREVAKGDEVSELSEEARTWNAAVDDDGKLRLQTAPARRKSSAKEA